MPGVPHGAAPRSGMPSSIPGRCPLRTHICPATASPAMSAPRARRRNVASAAMPRTWRCSSDNRRPSTPTSARVRNATVSTTLHTRHDREWITRFSHAAAITCCKLPPTSMGPASSVDPPHPPQRPSTAMPAIGRTIATPASSAAAAPTATLPSAGRSPSIATHRRIRSIASNAMLHRRATTWVTFRWSRKPSPGTRPMSSNAIYATNRVRGTISAASASTITIDRRTRTSGERSRKLRLNIHHEDAG